MATLQLNKELIHFDANKYNCYSSLINELQKDFAPNIYHDAHVKINNIFVDIATDNLTLAMPIREQDKIQIKFDHSCHLFTDIIYEVHELINQIIAKIPQSVKQESFNSIAPIISSVDVFIKSMSYVNKHLREQKINYSFTTTKELQIHLLSVMRAINTAQNNQDLIMLSDLLEYELKDNLKQWKILIMPELRQKTQVRL